MSIIKCFSDPECPRAVELHIKSYLELVSFFKAIIKDNLGFHPPKRVIIEALNEALEYQKDDEESMEINSFIVERDRRALSVKSIIEGVKSPSVYIPLSAPEAPDRQTSLSVAELVAESFDTAEEKGWHDEERSPGELVALIHEEVSECLRAFRDNGPKGLVEIETIPITCKPEGWGIELADIMIRVADTAKLTGVDLDECLAIKMAYNKTRPYRHGGKFL